MWTNYLDEINGNPALNHEALGPFSRMDGNVPNEYGKRRVPLGDRPTIAHAMPDISESFVSSEASDGTHGKPVPSKASVPITEPDNSQVYTSENITPRDLKGSGGLKPSFLHSTAPMAGLEHSQPVVQEDKFAPARVVTQKMVTPSLEHSQPVVQEDKFAPAAVAKQAPPVQVATSEKVANAATRVEPAPELKVMEPEYKGVSITPSAESVA